MKQIPKPIPLKYEQVCLPKFNLNPKDLGQDIPDVNYFDLSSHKRAQKAILFGLKMRDFGSNVFVVSGDQRGRVMATMEYLEDYIKTLPPTPDWVYLNNFALAHRPTPFKLPTGKGTRLRVLMTEFVESVHAVFNKTLTGGTYVTQVNTLTTALESEIQGEIETLQEFAITKGLRIESGADEFTILSIDQSENIEAPETVRDEKNGKARHTQHSNPKLYTQEDIQYIRGKLGQITSSAHMKGRELNKKINELKMKEANQVLKPLIQPLITEFGGCLGEWIDELKDDILQHIDDFLEEHPDAEISEAILRRYAVNVLVDNHGCEHPKVIIDPSPTYESLFGSIKYKSMANGYQTDFSMIRAGNIHHANGGILILRSENLATDMELWSALKVALRDKMIRIEERHRESAMPMLDAPDPQPIPLDLQIFLIGAPQWYYSFFFNDPEFRTYFKVKADIEPEMPVSQANIRIYTRLIRQFAKQYGKNPKEIEGPAIEYILGYGCRWMGNRKLLSSKIELISNIVKEANQVAQDHGSDTIRVDHVIESIDGRRFRNSVLEDRSHRNIEENLVLIDTQGKAIGAINGLSVLSTGDHDYGLPNRISARTFVGDEGVINIERLTDMGGPIQQKGAMILDGFIQGQFAQTHPVSCSCSLTFEQNYSGVEGDSASLAELLAILSSIAKVPIRQDIAVTGSINQFGVVQAVGGINHKVEGFYRVCHTKGLTGKQGVIMPRSNQDHIILRDDISEAIRDKKFHVWTVQTVEEAIYLMMDMPAGTCDAKGQYPDNTIYGLVSKQLTKYHKAMSNKRSNK